jgi:predicted enzyme related to lactoylglutathione lyase
MELNTVCHVELLSTDPNRSRAFFEGLFGWQFREFGSMFVFGTGESHIGGLTKADAVHPASHTQVYFSVRDIDDALGRVDDLGGSVLNEKHEVPSVGWSAEVGDPDGNPIGLVQFFEVAT